MSHASRVRNHVVLDDRGWTMPDPDHGCWEHRDSDFVCRRNMPWSPAEDRALLSMEHQLAERNELTNQERTRLLWTVHARTPCAIETRLQSLRAGLRLAALAKLAEGT
jgi:hypothetical protein